MSRKTNLCMSLISGVMGSAITYFFMKKKDKVQKPGISKEDKFRRYYQLTNQWLYNKNRNISVSEILLSKGYRNIAIYGMGELGSRLYEELEGSDIVVSYAIDQYPESNFTNLMFCQIGEDLKKVDAIIVTPVFDFDSIEANLKSVADFPVVSLEDILYQ